MQADYLDAHQRHWDDAERLYGACRWANADHLYGMAAECGLKQLMRAFGMPFDENRSQPAKEQDRKHADAIWARYESYRCGHHQGCSYVLTGDNPFDKWEVSQRYANQSHFSQARARTHQAGAQMVCNLVRQAQYDGLLP